MSAGEDAPQAEPSTEAQAAPGIEEALRGLHEEGRAGLKAVTDAARALQHLVVADVALARSALAWALVCVAVAIVFGASSWLLLMAAMIAALQAAGMSWLAALLVAATLSLAVTAAAAWGAARYFEHTRLDATRRQLLRLGLGGVDADADA